MRMIEEFETVASVPFQGFWDLFATEAALKSQLLVGQTEPKVNDCQDQEEHNRKEPKLSLLNHQGRRLAVRSLRILR